MTPTGIMATTVSHVMHAGVIGCRPETTLAELAGLMADHGVHCVVVDGDRARCRARRPPRVGGRLGPRRGPGRLGRLRGERGDRRRAGPHGSRAAWRRRIPWATRPTSWSAHGVTHLVVVSERTGSPVGVISTLDVARAAAEGGA